ncbi:MAG TPA: hypothetical protein PKJ69_11750 [Spirochaetota bacterium]|jgi:hypothetical protein|nr:hypothetical protein [Spirochaetota bacterium]
MYVQYPKREDLCKNNVFYADTAAFSDCYDQGAAWSEPSRKLYLAARQIAEYYDGSIKFAFVNVDDVPEATAQCYARIEERCCK